MNKDKILVLGASGFVGAALIDRLVEQGWHVIALGHAEAVEHQGRLMRVRGTIEDGELLTTLLADCSQVVYAASRTTPGTSAREPELEIIGNLLPLGNLLKCMARFSGKKLVYLSSAGAIYGDIANDATECSPLRPRSYYGAGKAAAEAFIHAGTMIGDMRANIIRPTNLYGPGQCVGNGFAIVPTLLQRARDGQPFQIWGDGSAVRDYIYLDDLLSALMLVLTRPPEQAFGIYNVASGCRASILELVELCQRTSGRQIRLEFKPARGVDVACVSPRSGRIAEIYGWNADTSLEAGLLQTWRWFLANAEANASVPACAVVNRAPS